MLQNTKKKAQGWFNIYANIDFVRPYFDVNTEEVLHRILYSILPTRASPFLKPKGSDLYGPFLICLSFVAVLLMSMRLQLNSYSVRGALIGTAFTVSFSYWAFASIFIFCVGFLFNSTLTFLQAASSVGYAMFGILVSSPFSMMNGFYFWITATMVIFALLSTIRLVMTLFESCPIRRQGFLLSCVGAVIHVGFLVFVEFFLSDLN